jgi:hypothetical protein
MQLEAFILLTLDSIIAIAEDVSHQIGHDWPPYRAPRRHVPQKIVRR